MRGIKNTLRSLAERFRQNSFVKSVLTISSGIVIAQGISFALSPIYSRIYDPSVFGEFSVMTSSGAIITSIICLGLITAIMLPKDDASARRICSLILLSVTSLGTLIFAVMLAISPYYKAFTVDSVPYWQGCAIVYLHIMITNISSLYYSYVNRKGLYRVLFWNPILGGVANGVITVALGLLGWGLIGYAIGTISAGVINIIHMARHVKPFDLRCARVIQTLKEYKQFPLLQLPANIISTYAQQLPILMISLYFGNAVLGIYFMTMRFLNIPVTLLAAPINRVYYRDASRRYADGHSIGVFTFDILKANIKLAIIPICLLMVFGEPVFAVLLGEKWRAAGTYAEAMGMYMLVTFCSSCVSGGFVITGRQKYNLLIAIISIVANAAAFFVGNLVFGDAHMVLCCFAAVNIVITLCVVGWFMCANGVKVKAFCAFIFAYIFAPSAVAFTLKLLLKKAGVL